MIKHSINTKYALFGIFYGMMITVPAIADDIEIYTSAGAATTPSTQANVLFALDTSGSMDTLVNTRATYDPSNDYGGGSGCYSMTKVYSMIPGYSFLTSNSSGTTNAEILCGFSTAGFENYINRVKSGSVKCDAADSLNTTGFFSGRVSQYLGTTWRDSIATKNEDNFIECEADSGIHGETSSNSEVWASDGSQWSSTASDSIDWGTVGLSTTLMNGNYINYIINEPLTTFETRMEVMQDVIYDLVDSMAGVNVGLMRFSSNGEGGMVTVPIEDISANRTTLQSELLRMIPGGTTPLSGSLYEAAMYYDGKAVDYGLTSTERNSSGSDVSLQSVSTSRTGNTYKSPIADECQKNFVLLLTDGDPVNDLLSGGRKGNVGISASSCGAVDDLTSNCLDEIAGSIVDPIVGTRDGISTYTVGFAIDNKLLTDTATKGDGKKYTADDKVELQSKLTQFFGNVYDTDTTFSAPAVSVNAFNRSVHINDLYFTLFKPANTAHWSGNLKKYKLDFFTDVDDVDGDSDITERLPFIADLNGDDAIDKTSGFFKETAVSYWTGGTPDGDNVLAGGVAAKLDLTGRNVVTYTGGYLNTSGVLTPSSASAATLMASFNEVDKTNTAVTNAMLGFTLTPPERITGTPRRQTLLDWAKGVDVFDNNDDGSVLDARYDMGDPLHSQPALVQYGETSGIPDLVAYVATNDGYLHAYNTNDGTELFSFIPQELLPNLDGLMDNQAGITYGLDGDVVAWIDDKDDNGTINGSDHVYLYIGMRRGGRDIYSVDVTDRNNPKLRWIIKGGTGDYTELGQTWSTVNVEKIKDGSGEKTVLIFGGGYDTNQDSVTVRTNDSVGRAIFIADADSGALLWSATAAGSTSVEGDMDYSIPARVKPLDINDDGYIDRLYAADMGGQILRFDIDETKSSFGASSISGGRIADLAGSGTTNARRFYYPPDAALIAERGKPAYIALTATSGYRAHPLDTDIQDRIYLLREKDVYNIPSSYTTITEADLFDTTLNLIAGDGSAAQNLAAKTSLNSKQGWFIKLDDQTGTNTWVGEKGLSESLIINGIVVTTTFIPTNISTVNSCDPQSGSGRVYFIDILDGSSAFPGDVDERGNRHRDLAKDGIPPSPNTILPKDGEATLCIGTECEQIGLGLGARKTYWYEEN